MIELGIARGAKIGLIGRGSDWAKGEPAFRRWEAHFHTEGNPMTVSVKQLILSIGVLPPVTLMFDGATYTQREVNTGTLQAWYWRNA